MTTETTDLTAERLAGEVTSLRQLMVDTQEALDWLETRLPLLPDVPISLVNTGLSIRCDNAEQYAQAVRVLMIGAPVGGVGKHLYGEFAEATRTFGAAQIEVWVNRAAVCELKTVGERTVVTAPLACVHCDTGIVLVGETWTHVTPEGDRWPRCGTSIDDDGNEVGGQRATPPALDQLRTETVPVTEWDCAPVLGSKEVAA